MGEIPASRGRTARNRPEDARSRDPALWLTRPNPQGQRQRGPREARRGRGRPRPAPLPQLLSHPQAAPRFAQLHGTAAHHQVRERPAVGAWHRAADPSRRPGTWGGAVSPGWRLREGVWGRGGGGQRREGGFREEKWAPWGQKSRTGEPGDWGIRDPDKGEGLHWELKAHGGEGLLSLGLHGHQQARSSPARRFQPSLRRPPSCPHPWTVMSPFLLHPKVQPAEWPVASLGARWTPLHRLPGRCPCELVWLWSAVRLSASPFLTNLPAPWGLGGGGRAVGWSRGWLSEEPHTAQ